MIYLLISINLNFLFKLEVETMMSPTDNTVRKILSLGCKILIYSFLLFKSSSSSEISNSNAKEPNESNSERKEH